MRSAKTMQVRQRVSRKLEERVFAGCVQDRESGLQDSGNTDELQWLGKEKHNCSHLLRVTRATLPCWLREPH